MCLGKFYSSLALDQAKMTAKIFLNGQDQSTEYGVDEKEIFDERRIPASSLRTSKMSSISKTTYHS